MEGAAAGGTCDRDSTTAKLTIRAASTSGLPPCGIAERWTWLDLGHAANTLFAKQQAERGRDVMKFGIFYELQLPRPWQEGGELKLYQDALTQLETADR